MKEFLDVLHKGVLIGMKGLGILIIRFRKRKISEYLRRLMRKEDSASTNISFFSGLVGFD